MAITYETAGSVEVTTGSSRNYTLPTGITAGDLIIIIASIKPSTNNTGDIGPVSGYTEVAPQIFGGGYGTTLGTDTGNTLISAWYRVADGTEGTTRTVPFTGQNVAWVWGARLSNATGQWDVAGATGQDTTAGSVSVTFTSDPGVTAGDQIICALSIPTDVTTPSQFSAEALSQTGVTFGTVTEIAEPDSSGGNDIGGVIVRAQATSGTGTAAPVFSATAGGTTTNVRGPAIFIRAREVSSGTTYDETPTDSAGLTDTVAGAVDFARTQTDSVGLTDTAAPVLAFVRTQDDVAGLTDTVVTVAAFSRTQTDSAGVTDSVSALVAKVATVDDAVGLSDAVTYVASWSRTLTDSTGVTDALVTSQAYVRTLDDGAGLTDAVVTQLGKLVQQDDPAGLTDSTSTAIGYGRVLTDAAGLADAASVGIGYGRLQTDSAGTTDAVTRAVDFSRSQSDAVGLVDSLATALARDVQQDDSVGLVDDVSTSLFSSLLTGDVNDDAGVLDSISHLVEQTAWIFTPPSRRKHPDLKRPHGLWMRIGVDVGLSVLQFGSTFRLLADPDPDDIESADNAYLGGRSYTIDQTQRDALVTAGYGAYIE